MKYELTNRISILALLVLALGLLPRLAPVAHAQILSRGNLFGPGAPPPMAGIEIGFGQHAEQGNLQCDCGSNFTTGTGTGLLGSLLFELPLDYTWAIGIKGGVDFKNFSTNGTINEVVIVIPPDPQLQPDTTAMYVQRTGKITATYLGFAPYVQYQFFRMGPFVQAGLDVGFLIGNNLSQSRTLLTTSITKPGDTLNNLTFTNGTTTESIQEGANQNVNTLRLGLLLSAGYNIQVSDRSVFCPLLTYDFPLTTTGNTAASNWKIGSLYATAELKFRLD